MKRYAVFGAGNIGFGVIEELAKKAEVCVFDIKKPDYLSEFMKRNGNVSFWKVDVTDETDLAAALKDIDQNSIDGAILTVGVSSAKTAFDDFDAFRSTVDINFFGNIVPIRCLVNNSFLKNPGKICVLASTSGHFAGLNTNAYASSKWMLVNACSSIRAELAERGIALDMVNPRTIKNIRSSEFKTENGIDVSTVVSVITKALEKETGRDYFIPELYGMFHIIERLVPWLFDLTQHVTPHFLRKGKYRWKTDTALITGASSGLGRELTKLYASSCSRIYVTARNMDALGELKNELKTECEIVPVKADFSESDSADKVVASIGDKIDLLINNAGHHVRASLLDVDLDVIRSTMQVNFYTPIRLITLLPSAHTVVNIISTTAVSGRRNLGVYSSTKAGLWCFSKALRRSKGNGINVIDVIPATFSSSLMDKGDSSDDKNAVMNSSRLSSSSEGLTSETVAKIVRSGIDKKADSIYIPNVKTRLYIMLEALAPKLFRKLFR